MNPMDINQSIWDSLPDDEKRACSLLSVPVWFDAEIGTTLLSEFASKKPSPLYKVTQNHTAVFRYEARGWRFSDSFRGFLLCKFKEIYGQKVQTIHAFLSAYFQKDSKKSRSFFYKRERVYLYYYHRIQQSPEEGLREFFIRYRNQDKSCLKTVLKSLIRVCKIPPVKVLGSPYYKYLMLKLAVQYRKNSEVSLEKILGDLKKLSLEVDGEEDAILLKDICLLMRELIDSESGKSGMTHPELKEVSRCNLRTLRPVSGDVKKEVLYEGFEQGPIRPPSEAGSLLIRITRNCPWNRCTFCPVYKNRSFSLRPVSHVLKDIDAVSRHAEAVRKLMTRSEGITRDDIEGLSERVDPEGRMAFNAALNWVLGGMSSIFLQDANTLIIKPDDLVTILDHIRGRFPWVKRITSYAHSHTIALIDDKDLSRIAAAGLNRVHIGMESGSDKVLALVRKGADKATHIKAGLKVKHAGMELSEYVIPGLGGVGLSQEHALETADALNQINADFIRLRTLAIPNHVEVFDDFSSGKFEKCNDRRIAEEILLFIDALDGISSTLNSDHILNLFEDVEGTLPEDKGKMMWVLRRFLSMPPEEQVLYQVGRRVGLFARLDHMNDPGRRSQAMNTCSRLGVTPENVDGMVDEIMKRFI